MGSHHLDNPSLYLPGGLRFFWRFFSGMQRLDGLIFEIHNLDNARMLKFSKLLKTIPQWTIPRFLTFRGLVHPSNFNRLARRFPSGTLEAVSISSRPNKTILSHLRDSHPSIKALCLWDLSNTEAPGYIAEYFPRVESIVIDQSYRQCYGPRHDEERIVRRLLVWPEYWHS
jgi:hypothetical protein